MTTRRGFTRACGLLAALGVAMTGAPTAAQPPPGRVPEPMSPGALEGRWIATAADGRVFAGTWTADLTVKSPNAGGGTWKALDETGARVLMEGTWSARKTALGVRGTWSGRAAGGGAAGGAWAADVATAASAKTFLDMFTLAGTKQVGGTWRTAHAHGNWWLKPLH